MLMSGRGRFACFLRSAMVVTVLAAPVAAQPPAPSGESDAVMGFEVAGSWTVSGNSPTAGFSAVTSDHRTQGRAAYAITNPPNLMTVVSQPISSSATGLAGIGSPNSFLQVDVFIPLQQGNRVNSGSMRMFVTSPSRGLKKVALEKVDFNDYRPGMYHTIRFAIPAAVREALSGATYNDLVVEFAVSSPGRVTGSYLMDHLRVHALSMPQSPGAEDPPAGYGGSVDFVIFGDAPATENFDLAGAQVPEKFHLKLGTVSTSSVRLQLGLDGTPQVACTYGGDPADATFRSFTLLSCEDGWAAGDLVKSNWASLAILQPDPAQTQHIRAQIALNPLGDVVGSGLLPPMPTFWGDADGCIPEPVAGQVVTLSASCAEQTTQANAIITEYFNRVRDANPAPNWIVTPVPEFAQRMGDPTPANYLMGLSTMSLASTSQPQTSAIDNPLFDTGGHLNKGGTFDAYWRLHGNLLPVIVPNTDQNKTHFEATFGTHAVLFGKDIDVVAIKLVADTDSGQTTPEFKPATSTGRAGLYLFGIQLPSGGYTVNPSTGFSIHPKVSDEFNLPAIQIWIFSVSAGAHVEAELEAAGSAAVAGLNLRVVPSAAVGVHVSGGVNLGVAKGTVQAKVNLASISAPVVAQAKWVINNTPQVCATTLEGKLDGNVNLSSGGGKIDLKATYGVCPVCTTDTYNIFKWDPLASSNWNLFDARIDTQLFALPTSMCSFAATATILAPTSGTTLPSSVPITISGAAQPDDDTLTVTNKSYTWTFTPGANASTATIVSGHNTAAPVVSFGAPTSGTTSTWTIGLTATITVQSAGGQAITSTTTAAPVTVNVSASTSGAYISQVTTSTYGVAARDINGVFLVGGLPETITISGNVLGAPSGALITSFTVAKCTSAAADGYTSTCSSTGPATTLTTANPATTNPSAPFIIKDGNGTYKVTMITTQDGISYGTTSVLIYYFIIL